MAYIKYIILLAILAALMAGQATAANVYTSEEIDSLIDNISEDIDDRISEFDEDMSDLLEKYDWAKAKIRKLEKEQYDEVLALKKVIEGLQKDLGTFSPKGDLRIIGKTSYRQASTDVSIIIDTSRIAQCRYSKEQAEYASMDEMAITGETKHKVTVEANEGLNAYFVSCRDNESSDEETIVFEVSSESKESGIIVGTESVPVNSEPYSEGDTDTESEIELNEKDLEGVTGSFVKNSSTGSLTIAVIIIMLVATVSIASYVKIYKKKDNEEEAFEEIKFDFKDE